MKSGQQKDAQDISIKKIIELSFKKYQNATKKLTIKKYLFWSALKRLHDKNALNLESLSCVQLEHPEAVKPGVISKQTAKSIAKITTLLKHDNSEQKISNKSLSIEFYSVAIMEDIEASPVYIIPDLAKIILGYLEGDIIYRPNKAFTLFGFTQEELINHEAAYVAINALNREEKGIERSIAKVKQDSALMHQHVVVPNRLGGYIKGTPLQILAINGDFNHGFDKGMVECFIEASKLPRDVVIEQLKVITSKEAQAETKRRNQYYLAAIKKLGKDIIAIAKTYKGKDYTVLKQLCQSTIDQFSLEIKQNSEIVALGWLFDPQIIMDASKWYFDHLRSFGGLKSLQSDVWWRSGMQKLVKLLSPMDQRVVGSGLGELIELPGSWVTVQNHSIDMLHYHSVFSPNSSFTQQSTYTMYYVPRPYRHGVSNDGVPSVKQLIQSKLKALQQFVSDKESKSQCRVM